MNRNKKQKKKVHSFSRLVILVLLAALALYAVIATGARYVLSDKISFNLSNYYCNVTEDNTMQQGSTISTNITVANNDGTNFMTSDLKYTIALQGSSDWDISASDGLGLTRTISGGAANSNTAAVTITPKNGQVLDSASINIVITVTSPYPDTKTYTAQYTPVPTTDGLGYSGVVPLNPLGNNITMTGYDNWPEGYTKSNSSFGGAIYDKNTHDIWMVPYSSAAVVKLNTTTGNMISYNSWPSGLTNIGSTSFAGGAQTDTDVWMVPRGANMVLKVNKTTGEMTGYNNWPTGFTKSTDAFIGGALVGTDLWMAPFSADRVIKVDTLTGEMTGYNNWPTGFSKEASAFVGTIYDGKYVWLIPYNATMLIRLDPTTGEMTGYSNWPTGFSKVVNAFSGGTFDGTNLWLAPRNASSVIKVNVATGEMTGYNNWPDGYNAGQQFGGAIYDGKTVWMIPFGANMVVGIDAATGEMRGYNNWPTGLTGLNTSSEFYGAVYDGKDVWMFPMNTNMLVKLSGGTVPIYNQSELLAVGSGQDISIPEAGGATYIFDTDSKYVLMNDISFDYDGVWNMPDNVTLGGNGHEVKIKDTSKSETTYYYYNDTSDYKYATTKEGYIYDDMLVYYDGINNTGSGHDASAVAWKDLSGNGNDGTLKNVNTAPLETKQEYGATWLKVFYHNAEDGTVYFTSAEAQNCNTPDKYSILDQLESYRNSNGNFEFLLEYPELPGEYNRWTQTSNPVTSSPHIVTGYSLVHEGWNTSYWGGLARSMGSSTFIDGSTLNGTGTTNWYYSIGSEVSWSGTSPVGVAGTLGIPGPNQMSFQQTELWVRVDNLDNQTLQTSGWTDNSLMFDGINDYVYSKLINPDNVTLEALYQFDSIPPAGAEVYVAGNPDGGGYGIARTPSQNYPRGLVHLNGAYRAALDTEPFVLGAKRKNAVTYDGDTLKMWNKTQVTDTYSYTGVIEPPTTNTFFSLGVNPGANGTADSGVPFFNGKIYTVRLYGRALSADEIAQNNKIDQQRYGMP